MNLQSQVRKSSLSTLVSCPLLFELYSVEKPRTKNSLSLQWLLARLLEVSMFVCRITQTLLVRIPFCPQKGFFSIKLQKKNTQKNVLPLFRFTCFILNTHCLGLTNRVNSPYLAAKCREQIHARGGPGAATLL